MRMQMTSQIDAGGNDPIFLMFHGYGNDESEMVGVEYFFQKHYEETLKPVYGDDVDPAEFVVEIGVVD